MIKCVFVFVVVAVVVMALGPLTTASAFTLAPHQDRVNPTTPQGSKSALCSPLFMSTIRRKKGYEPKWKKKKTLEEKLLESGEASVITPKDKGIKGNINVVFKQGNETRSTLAMAGQPLRDVATQAGQFIKYGCGKGECGTCEALVNGQWIRPCSVAVPAVAEGEDYVVMVKEIKSKKVDSGKFYSLKSFLLGFWNNLLGMVGFFKSRRAAKKNWSERKEYEDLIKQKALEKKLARQKQDLDEQNK